MYTSHFTPLQLQFYATTSNTLIIKPTYDDQQQIYLKGKKLPAFKVHDQTVVPAWLAIFLKEKQKCTIIVPEVYRLEQLQRFVQRENVSNDPIFLHEQCFFELVYTLLNRAPDTFEKPRQVRSLVESLETIRFQKLRKTIENTTGGRRLKYFTTYQINKWRSGLSSLERMVDHLGPTKKQQK